jgi:hypothetical protein
MRVRRSTHAPLTSSRRDHAQDHARRTRGVRHARHGGPGSAEPIVINPFGTLTVAVTREPTLLDPGAARLTINTGSGAAFSGGSTIYFGLRIMGTEDVEMTSFSLPTNPTGSGRCIVSDFAGRNTSGWQGAPVFGTNTGVAGSANSHMKMIGGFIRKSCGDIVINVSFRAKPFVAYYAAFFGYNPAPWHNNYGTPPWNTVPTGGDTSTQAWWNIWGTFDTLGYSNAVTYG